ncbi:hypothetical protein CHH57_13160 [Niallia circulans]|uniref:Uncharacterized protein n=1 Tax=Niallia circulans TaxID=1397 RepID=A0AA91Z0W6_NIACI|nr:hypothetical protein [Niallia circulans]PAD82760.1 hypothetical protein CHH57_13160 [Niallia circulans]
MKNLSEVWQHVVSSNAVLEIIDSTTSLKRWAMTKREDGTWPLKEFQLEEAPKKLKFADVYSDSINILKNIAERDGVLNKLNNSLREDNYFPESLFYQLLGYPEHIILNTKAVDLDIVVSK